MLRRLIIFTLFLVFMPLCAQLSTAVYASGNSTSKQAEQAAADTVHTAPQVVQYDSSAIGPRSAEDALQKFRNDPDFAYDRTVSINPTLWEQFLGWLGWLIRSLLPKENSLLSRFWEIFFYVFVGAVLVYAIFRLTGTSFGGLFGRAGKRVVETEMLEENIHELDFNKLIDEAAQQQQYRKALRLLYLRSLKELSDSHYIQWSIDKTNREYLAELPSGELRKSFGQLTLLFEYIWYGDFPVDRSLFDRSHELFRNFSTSTTRHV